MNPEATSSGGGTPLVEKESASPRGPGHTDQGDGDTERQCGACPHTDGRGAEGTAELEHQSTVAPTAEVWSSVTTS